MFAYIMAYMYPYDTIYVFMSARRCALARRLSPPVYAHTYVWCDSKVTLWRGQGPKMMAVGWSEISDFESSADLGASRTTPPRTGGRPAPLLHAAER